MTGPWVNRVSLVLALSTFVSSCGPEPFGRWEEGSPAPDHLLATHAILLRNNKILVVGGSSYNCCFSWGKEEARLYDIASDTWSDPMPSPAPYGPRKDAFCGGHAHDDAGRVIFQGGLLGYGEKNGFGIDNTARYDLSTGVWTQLGAAAPHWYPTLVAGVRHMFLFPGRATGGDDYIRKMKYGTSSWWSTGSRHITKSTYPRVVLLPSGKFFIGSPADAVEGQADRRNYFYDPVTNTLTTAGDDVVPESDPSGIHGETAWHDTGVLLPLVPSQGDYPSVKFALFNGVNGYFKDLAAVNPTWQAMAARPPGLGTPPPLRHFANSTLLPTGQVFVSGGVRVSNSDATAVGEAEVYDPTTDSWLATDKATVPRNYHGTALLLPDGRVWTASGSQNEKGSECAATPDGCEKPPDGMPENTEERVEIFIPWYYGRSDRPMIRSCPRKISTDGGRYSVEIGGPRGSTVDKVVLMRPGSVTHSFDSDQRLVELEVLDKQAGSVTVAAPFGATAAPPGDYMLFVLRSIASSGAKRWLPSVACWTRVEPQVTRHDILASDYQGVFKDIASQGYRPVWVDGFDVGGQNRFNAIFTHADIPWEARHGMDAAAYQVAFNNWVGQGFRLAQVDSYLVSNQIRYAAIWEKRPGPEWTAYHGTPQAVHQARFDSLVSEGYRPVNISVVNVGGRRYVTALYDKANVGKFLALAGLTESEYQEEFDEQNSLGLHPAYVNAFREGGVQKITAIWNQAPAGAWVARHGMTSTEYQTEFDDRIGQGLLTRAVAGYETGGSSRFIAWWSKR